MLVSRGLQAALTGTLQALVVVAVALAFGAASTAAYPDSRRSCSLPRLVCAAFATFSHALALQFRRHQTMIAVGQFAVLPFMFLSVTLISAERMPA